MGCRWGGESHQASQALASLMSEAGSLHLHTTNEGLPTTGVVPAMPTVYLIAQPTIPRGPGKKPFDVTPLYEHGEVVVLVRAGEYPTFNPGDCLELIEKRLAKYDPQQDCVAWAGGDTLSAILAGVVLADLGHETMTYLRHERGRDANGKRTDEGGRYTRITVPLWTKRAKQHVQHDPRQQDLFTTHEGAHAHGS